MKLPESTTQISWVTFVLKLANRDLNSRIVFGVSSLAGLVLGLFVMNILTAAPVVGVLVGITVATLLLKAKYVRPVIVLIRSQTGKPFIDLQEWWATDERPWPDSWRWKYEKRRILVIDSLGDEPKMFDPWTGPMPAGKGVASPTDLLQAQLEAGAIKDTLAVDRSAGETLRLGLLISALAGSGIAIIMAADRLITALGGTV